MSDAKSPLEQALDLFVYAPLGLLLNADEVIPNLIERGRQQVTMARMFGQFAVQQGQTEATKAASKLQEQATEVVEQLSGRSARRTAPAAARAASAPPPASAPVAKAAPAKATPPKATSTAATPAAATLAIPDYDSLSASQVVPRLEGLSEGELDAVRAYEAANRGRKTILSKITALQG